MNGAQAFRYLSTAVAAFVLAGLAPAAGAAGRPMSRVLAVPAVAAKAAGICSLPVPGIAVTPDPVVTPVAVRGFNSPPAPFTIQNTGTGSLVIGAIVGEDPPGLPCECSGVFSVIDTNGCAGATLAPGASCTAFAAFLADTQLDTGYVAEGTIAISSNDPLNPVLAVPVSGTVGVGVLSVSTAQLNFGGTTFSPQVPVTLALGVSNAGTLPITLSAFAFGTFAVVPGPSCPGTSFPFALAAGNGCDLLVTFAPTAGAIFSSTVFLNFSDGAVSDFFDVAVTGAGIGSGGSFGFSPSSVDFFSLRRELATGSTPVTATNLGVIPHTVASVSVGPPFLVNGDACTAAPIPPGGSCQILVLASAVGQAPGNYPGSIAVTSTAGVSTVPLSVDVVPGVAWNPFSSVFPDTLANGTSAPITFTLENLDSFAYPLALGTATADFTITGGSCLALTLPASPGGGVPGTCTVDIAFTPGTTGFKFSTFNATVAGVAITASVSGQAVAPGPRLALSPGAVFFPLGQTGVPAQVPVTAANVGTSPTPTALAFSSDNAEVTVNPGTCTLPLAASATCTFDVIYSRATARNSASPLATVTVQTTDTPTPSVTASLDAFGSALATFPAAVEAFPAGPLAFPTTLVNTDSQPLEISLGNTGSGPTSLDITGIVSSSPEFVVTNDCPASPSQLPPQACCLATVTFRPAAGGSRAGTLTVTTSAGNLAIGLGGTGLVPSATAVAKLFAPATVPVGAVSTLTVTLTNTNAFALSNVSFTDAFPGGLAVAPVPALTNSCGGTATATPGGASLGLAGGSIPAGSPVPAACSVSVAVIGLTPSGGLVNAIGPGGVSAAETAAAGVQSPAASSTLVVTGTTPLPSALTFTPGTVLVGTASTLDLNFANPNPADFTNGSLLYSLPAGLAIANPAGAAILGGPSCSGNISATPGGASFAVTNFSVPTSGACDVQVSVTAASAGSYPATIAAGALQGSVLAAPTGNAVPSISPVTLTVTPLPAPVLTIAPPAPGPLDFGPVTVGSPSPPLDVAIANTGNAVLAFSGAFAVSGDFAQTATTCGATLQPPPGPANACTVTIVFTPTAAGVRGGTLSVASNGGNAVLNLTGSGTPAPVPAISLSVGSLTFPSQTVGTTSAAQTLAVTSAGTAPLAVSSVAVSGDFSIASPCTAASPLAPGATCGIEVKFTPIIVGTRTGQVSVTSNDPGAPTSVVTLSGVGAAPPAPGVSLVPAALVFPTTTAGQASAPRTAVLTNTGGLGLAILAIDVVGTGFTVSNNCGSVVAPGGSCTLTAVFTPAGAGSYATDVRIITNADGGPSFLRLSGAATAAPVGLLSASPASLSFADQVIGTTSAPRSFTVANTGAATMSISRIEVSGDFALEGRCFDLRPGDGCAFRATFTPSQLGTRSGQIVFTSDAANGVFGVSLGGRGVPVPGPRVSLSASALGFGNTLAGTTAVQAVTLTNAGNEVLVLGAVETSGDYLLRGTCTGSLAPDESCRIVVGFSPRIPGVRVSEVRITSNAPGSPHRVSLSGVGCRLSLSGRSPALICAP